MSAASSAGTGQLRSAPTSLLTYSPAFILVAIAAADASRVADTDLWGHLLAGQWILSHRQFLRHDPYSYSAPGTLWVNHEWLSEVLMALSYQLGGVVGLKLLKFAGVAGTLLFSALAISETEASPVTQQVILIIEAVALRLQVQCRPELSSLVLLSWLLMLIARDTYRGPASLWIAIPIFALWCNLHGGFVAGLAVLGLYFVIAAIQDAIAGRGIGRAMQSGALIIAATLITLINPYGTALWINVWHTVSNPLIRQMIGEWHPLIPALAKSGRNPAVLIVCLPTLLLMVSLAICVMLKPHNRDLALVAIGGLFSVSAFYAARNLRLATVALCVPLAFHVELVRARGLKNSWRDLVAALTARCSGSQMAARPRLKAAGNIAEARIEKRSSTSPLLVAIAAFALAASTGLFSPELKAGPGMSYPAGALAFMMRRNLHGNLLCDYNWAGYVIWHTWPRSRIFIDGRCETVYPAQVIEDYARFRFGLTNGARVLRAYPHDYVLVPAGSEAYKVTMKDTNWLLLYSDSQATLFMRASMKPAGFRPERLASPAVQFRFP